MAIDLAFVWAALIAFAVLAYVVLDGFDLGVGVLFLFFKKESSRDLLMNSVAPIWDGNETWLVLGGGGLFAVFPLAYATLLPALYAPITAMLLALVFRGVAFEFRWRTRRGKFMWDWAFGVGSTVAAFAQGLTLGALVQGITIEGRAYAGGWWDWLTPFSLLTGLALVVGYAFLGAGWLIMKTEERVQRKAYRCAWITGAATLVLIGVVSLWTPFLQPTYLQRWFGWPTAMFTVVVPTAMLACIWLVFRGLREGRDRWPFLGGLGVFILCYGGILVSFYPNIVPPDISIWDAAAPDDSLLFLLVGASVLLPIILAYTAYSYWVFRGKLDPSEGYH